MDSYFYVFKLHFEWNDYTRRIIGCDVQDDDHYYATITLHINSNVICLNKGTLDFQMPEDDFRDFILKATHGWVKKQKEKPSDE